jgi:hypothetical protein
MLVTIPLPLPNGNGMVTLTVRKKNERKTVANNNRNGVVNCDDHCRVIVTVMATITGTVTMVSNTVFR